MRNAYGLWVSVPLGLHLLVGTAGGRWFQAESISNSCVHCHSLDEVLPEGHSRDDIETVDSCTNCHARERGSAAFRRMVHWKHYARETFTGDCWSCHSMEEEARFRLIGTNQGAGVEVSRDKPGQMSSYFKSWASSEYLDRRHGEQGTDCLDCHSSFFPDGAATMEICLDCHGGYPDLAAADERRRAQPARLSSRRNRMRPLSQGP